MAYPPLPEEPTFLEEDFIFVDGDEIPEHVEDLPGEEEQSRLLWGIEDRSAVAYDQTQVIAINLRSVGLAEMMARARLRKIEALQPSSVTGGQAEGGIQDHVTIVHPYNYSNTTRFNPSLEELFGHSTEQQPTRNVLVLPTEREGLVLRTLANSDDDKAYFEAVEEDRVHLSQFGETTAKYYKTLQDVRERRMIISNKIRLGIWDHDNFKGTVNAQPSKDENEAEIGYWLRASAVGNGYATLAVKALTEHLTPRFDRVFAEVHVENKPSIKVMQRAGYSETGRVGRDWGNAIIFEPAK